MTDNNNKEIRDAVILAGGKGTRLRHLSAVKPKPLVEIAGKAMVIHQLELLARHNVKRVWILTGHLGEQFQPVLGDGKQWGVDIKYHRENEPLGTAGGLREIADQLPESFFVLYGDIIFDMDLHAFAAAYRNSGSIGALAVHPNDHPQDSDLVEFDQTGRILQFHPKNRNDKVEYENYVNAAVYCLNKKIINHIPSGKQDFGLDVFPKAIQDGAYLYAYRTAEFIKDVGTPARLKATEQKIFNGKVRRLNRKYQQKAVFLDRDGVVIEEAGDALTVDSVQVIAGAGEAIRMMQDQDFHVFLVTNQPGIAKGFIDWHDVSAVHGHIDRVLAGAGAYLTDKFVCPHHPESGHEGEREELKTFCECRKPKPGLLRQARERYNIDFSQSFLIGDRTVDAAAAIAVGCKPLFVSTGFGGKDGLCNVGHVNTFPSLVQAAAYICKSKSQ